ncbi:MAG: murein biosynthesis integral membrane protein MurJ [Alphaproteobacteria bacterium]|nr:murein biosynthesis integral membrane protein MurJ [Alphaproteobacteria bacterium]
MSLLKSVFSVSSLTVLSRITGYIRDLLLAQLIGANAISDAINIAVKIPSFFRRIFAEGAFHVSFLPSYTHTQKNKVFAGMVLSMLLLALGCLTLGIELYYAPLSKWLLTDAHPDTLGYVQQFGPIVFPYIFFISVVTFFGSILNAHGRFSAPAISQSIGNITVILFVSCLSGFTSETGLLFSWGVLLSGIIQTLFMAYSSWKGGYFITPCWPKWTDDIKQFLKKFAPGLLSVSTVQINTIIVPLYLSCRLPVGSLSYLQYADRLYQLPLSIIGIALSSVLLPMLAEKIKAKDQESIDAVFSQALRLAWIVTVPSLILMELCSFPIVITLFGSGKLSVAQLISIANIVKIYALGVPAYIVIKIFTARFFAARDMTTPLIGGIISAIIDVMAALILVDYLQHLALALAACIASWGYAIFLVVRLMQRDGWVLPKSLRVFFLKTTGAGLMSAASVFCVSVATGFYVGPFDALSLWSKIGGVALFVGTCGVTFLAGLWKMGICSPETMDAVVRYFRRKQS